MVRSKRIAFNFTLEIEINTLFISTKEKRSQALCEWGWLRLSGVKSRKLLKNFIKLKMKMLKFYSI